MTSINSAQRSIIAIALMAAIPSDAGLLTEEVLVTAARSNYTTFELPYTVQVLTNDEITKSMPRNMPEALVELTGILVQKTANGQGSPFIRGFTGYRTLTLIDGVRYNNSVYRDGPNEYFSLIDSHSLDSIELLSGPASTLYGSDAIGGTLNLATPSVLHNEPNTSGFIHGQQDYRYSSAENSHISRTEFHLGESNQWGVKGGYSWKSFGDVKAADIGSQAKTGYDEQAFDLRFDKQLNDQWLLTLTHQSLQQDDVWRTHSTIYAKSFADTTIGDDLRRLKDQQRSLSYAKLIADNALAGIDQLQLTLSHQRWDENGDRVRDDGKRSLDYFDSRMNGIDLQLQSHWRNIQFIYGFDFYRDQVDSGRTDYNPDGSINKVRIQGPVGDDSRYDLLGIYAQATVDLSEKTTLTVGSRYTDTHARIGRFQDPETNEAASFNDSWQQTVSSLRLSHMIGSQDQWQLWGGISQSFRAPNIADLSRYGKSRSDELEVAATDLDPEQFLTYEIGLKVQFEQSQWSASYYYTNIRDFIISTPTGRIIDSLNEVKKQNSSKGFIQGIEVDGQYFFSPQLSIEGNITWLEGDLDIYDVDLHRRVTEPFSRIMPLTLHLALNGKLEPLNSWWRIQLTHAEKASRLSSGDKNDTERIPPGGTPAYTTVNLQAGAELNQYLQLTIGLENIFDQAYRSHGSGSNEPGRGINIGLSAHF